MFSSNAVSTIFPSNVHLADTSILQPKVEKKIPFEEYIFPTLQNPIKIGIKCFLKPEQELSQSANLDSKIFSVAIRKDIVNNVVRYQRNKIRQPHKTKRIGEISGSTKKQRPQKGGGTSRAGNRRSSIWKGGQKAHGPVLRDFSIKLTRKYRALGMMIALAAKHREGNLMVFDNFQVKVQDTKPSLLHSKYSHPFHFYLLFLL